MRRLGEHLFTADIELQPLAEAYIENKPLTSTDSRKDTKAGYASNFSE